MEYKIITEIAITGRSYHLLGYRNKQKRVKLIQCRSFDAGTLSQLRRTMMGWSSGLSGEGTSLLVLMFLERFERVLAVLVLEVLDKLQTGFSHGYWKNPSL